MSSFSRQFPSDLHFDSADPTARWTGTDAAFAAAGRRRAGRARDRRNALLPPPPPPSPPPSQFDDDDDDDGDDDDDDDDDDESSGTRRRGGRGGMTAPAPCRGEAGRPRATLVVGMTGRNADATFPPLTAVTATSHGNNADGFMLRVVS
jgi:hypothetical protein